MSPGPERCDMALHPFTYTNLPPEPPHPTTRMIRLLPNKDRHAGIECEIFNYDFALSTTGGDSHLYEALSYVWGSGARSRTITLNSRAFTVTENLYIALSHLRNRQLERLLWVDAICINQDDRDEKAKQIPLLRTIFAEAQHVIVWLGEAKEGGDKALEGLRDLAGGHDIESSKYDEVCLKLLLRPWFRRIWVLQEVGVARSIHIMCGFVQITGYVFCEGLRTLNLPPTFREMIGPIAFLIKRALSWPKHELYHYGTLTIGELAGMYCRHEATEQHDKIYALLGLSADPITPDLTPNYELPWHKVFKQVTSHIFPECSVETWHGTDTAVIKGKGWVLGHIYFIGEKISDFGQQNVKIHLNDTASSVGYESKWGNNWKLQAFARTFMAGDIIFLLQGAAKPSIIRLCRNHFTIITPALTLPRRHNVECLREGAQNWHSSGGLCRILLTWRIPLNDSNNIHFSSEGETELLYMAPSYEEEHSEAEERRNQVTQTMVGVAMEAVALRQLDAKDIEHLLLLSGTEGSIAGELAEACATDTPYLLDTFPRDFREKYQQDNLSLSEDMVKAVAENEGACGYIIMELLFQLQGKSLPFSEEVVKVAATNPGWYGYQVMKTIWRHRGELFPVSEQVIKAAAENRGAYGSMIMEFLLQFQGEDLPVSEEVVLMAARNDGGYGYRILEVLLKVQGESLPVSEEVVTAAADNATDYDYKALEVLFEARGESLPFPEEVFKAAAGNHLVSGRRIMELVFQYKGESLSVSEEVVRLSAENTSWGYENITCLFELWGKRVPVSEEVVRAAAGNTTSGNMILLCIFQYQQERVPISEDVVKAAAGNEGCGTRCMSILLKEKGGKLPVTEEALKAAAANTACGREILEIVQQSRDHSTFLSTGWLRAFCSHVKEKAR